MEVYESRRSHCCRRAYLRLTARFRARYRGALGYHRAEAGCDVQRLYKRVVGKVIAPTIRQQYRRQNSAGARRRRCDDAVHAGVALAHAQRRGKNAVDELPAYPAAACGVCVHLRAVPAGQPAVRAHPGVVRGVGFLHCLKPRGHLRP